MSAATPLHFMCGLHYCPAALDSTCTCTHISQLPHFILIMRVCPVYGIIHRTTCASHSTDIAKKKKKTHIFRQFHAYWTSQQLFPLPFVFFECLFAQLEYCTLCACVCRLIEVTTFQPRPQEKNKHIEMCTLLSSEYTYLKNASLKTHLYRDLHTKPVNSLKGHTHTHTHLV